jgi:hypothetical protein
MTGISVLTVFRAIAFPMGLIPFHTTYASVSQTNRRLTEQEACRDLRNEFMKFFTIIRQNNLDLSSLHPSTSTLNLLYLGTAGQGSFPGHVRLTGRIRLRDTSFAKQLPS